MKGLVAMYVTVLLLHPLYVYLLAALRNATAVRASLESLKAAAADFRQASVRNSSSKIQVREFSFNFTYSIFYIIYIALPPPSPQLKFKNYVVAGSSVFAWKLLIILIPIGLGKESDYG
ncbi:hypothetical protein C8J55DRAFT_493356 [Lentinula edodes]|uniref:Uncharacterized protein n=1 Tax=Lentinula lateritia TaxID=40482 RepID=A0A9W8ZSP0_9AGAR|nr:hypothetical protein C8J55DRAFT_493356 [Lentinula edodes]